MSRASSPARSAGEQELGENDKIDIEQLITLMYRRPPLWDKFDAKYHDRVLKARLWEEIYKQIKYILRGNNAVLLRENKKVIKVNTLLLLL